jgi:hypothetical protein
MRALIMSAALVLAARAASAQDPLTAAKKSAQKAKAAADAHTEAMQRPDGSQKTAPKTAAPGAGISAGVQRPGSALNVATSDTAGPPAAIMREVFDYAKQGRRDPFVSLLTTTELRPTMSDLKVTNVLIDMNGRNSIAILRDVATNTQYRVRVGSTLGRMRVAAIRGNTIVLTIDEFGTTRQDSLILRDSTKARRP